ncbi:MAG: Lrp/AsnC family transcriptional regulator [Candidatus Odinarchaeota archaeon]
MSRDQAFIDPTDKKIIDFLKKDPRISKKRIARFLNISRQTVQKRIAGLEERGIIKFTCQVNDSLLGKEVTTLVLITLDKTKRIWSRTATELLSRKDELDITAMYHVTGNYDIILKMVTRNIRSLEENLAKIAGITGVARTQTMVCLSHYEETTAMGNEGIWDAINTRD